MRMGWLIVGIVIAVLLFLFFPGLFHALVSGIKSIINFLGHMVEQGNLTA